MYFGQVEFVFNLSQPTCSSSMTHTLGVAALAQLYLAQRTILSQTCLCLSYLHIFIRFFKKNVIF